MERAQALVRRGRGASGAVVAQLVQALTSLVLQLVAVRALGAEGLGVFGLLYSGLVLAAALTAGLVGDSLTVLDRGRSQVRAGLQLVGLSVSTVAGVVGALASWATGLLTWQSSLVLGAGVAVFIIEDLLRRLLMASLRFWSVAVVDVTALGVTISWLMIAALFGPLRMSQLLLALLLAQTVGVLTALRLLPGSERWWAPWRGADVAAVFRYGRWRAAQQGVRPATLTVTRILVVAVSSTAVFGQLEAARVYTAPTLLVVNGIAGFLFASYAAEQHRPLVARIRRADIGALASFVTVLLGGSAVAAAAPWAGRFVTGSAFSLETIAVFGWVVYAATAAVLTPYGGLASVSGMHAKVFALRVADAAVSVGVAAALLFVFDVSVSWVPYALAGGALANAAIIRRHVLLPEAGVQGVVSSTEQGP